LNAADRRRRIEDLCHAALARDPKDRAAFVATACGSDEGLCREVEALLAHAQTAEGFLAPPLEALAAAALTDERGAALVGRSLGAYQIRAWLGSGGMGDVYRAHDSKLGRDVAIKILPAVFSSDVERLARFEREARLLASLNYPNIATIHGLEKSEGIRALVMELVDGPTIAERLIPEATSIGVPVTLHTLGSDGAFGRQFKWPQGLSKGPLPVTEAMAIAIQIAHALDAAHERGIVHRDLKPA
jgi:serine/threonine protein kinase